MIYRVDIEAVAPVHPTEDPDRVASAIEAIFPTAEIRHATGEVIGQSHSLDRFAELLARQRIQETVRTTLHDAVEGDVIAFAISKQAASVGVVNFALDEPAELGDIHVAIRVDQPEPRHLIESVTTPDGDT